MSVIRIEDIAYVRFSAPDLEEMAAFLRDFGLDTYLHSDRKLYAKTRDGSPYSHVTEKGKPGFVALGLKAESIQDLEKLAASEQLAPQTLDAPGGGKYIRLTDPSGFPVEVIAGQKQDSPSPAPYEFPRNSAQVKPRKSQRVALVKSPSHICRLGHCVLNVADFRKSEHWYKERFGLLTSDEIEAASGLAVGAFMRCDRGEKPTDHHTLFLIDLPGKASFMHAAFEVTSLDSLMLGHAYMKAKKRKSKWGVGRHVLGSQVFDYWQDPWGHELEHWTDGDLFTSSDETARASVSELLDVQWGMKNPAVSGVFAPGYRLITTALSFYARLKRRFRKKLDSFQPSS